jgi:hypothetical protein
VVSASDAVPAAYWRLDDGLGSSTASDSVGGHRGTLNGGVSWSPAVVLLVNGSVPVWDLGRGRTDSAWALDFDGKSGYVWVPDAAVLRSGSFSVAFWAAPDSSGDWDNVMGKQIYQNGEQSGWMICWDDSTPRTLGLVIFDQSHMGSPSVRVPMTLGEWAHIVFTVGDGSIGAYKNGVFLGRSELRGYQPVSEPFRMGKAFGDEHYYDGLLDDVRFYNSPLSDSDVKLLYTGYDYSNPSSHEISTVVEAVKVSLTPGAENWLGAKLMDQTGRMLVGVHLSFTVDGNTLGTGLTGPRGFIWIPYYPAGSSTHTLKVSFNGAEGFAAASDTVQLAAAGQAPPLQQYTIIGGAIAAVALGIVTVLVLSRRRRAGSSEELAQAMKDALTRPQDGQFAARAP